MNGELAKISDLEPEEQKEIAKKLALQIAINEINKSKDNLNTNAIHKKFIDMYNSFIYEFSHD